MPPTSNTSSEAVRAYLYASKSTPDEKGSNDSQLEACRKGAEGEGRIVAGVFHEDDKSGWKGNRGIELERALVAAEVAAAEFGHAELWVWKSERLARGSGRKNEARSLLEVFIRCKRAGVELRSVEDDAFVRNEEMIGMASRMAEKYSADLSVAVKKGMVRSHGRGKHNGKPPFGYEKLQGELVVHPLEAAVVRRIFEERASGISVKQISRNLDADGIPTKRGGKWASGVLNGAQSRPGILTNRVYLGEVRHGDDWIDGKHEAIIEQELWDKVEALRESYKREDGSSGARGRPTKGKHLFTHGLLRCGACGSGMHPRKQGGYESYTCLRKSYGCETKTLPRAAVDATVFNYFEAQILDFDATVAYVEQQSGAALSAATQHRDSTEVRVAQLRREREGAIADYRRSLAEGDGAGDVFKEVMQGIAAELEEAETAHEAACAEVRLIAATSELGDGREESIRALSELRAAIAGDVAQADGLDALRAALRIRFDHFVLTHTGNVEDAVIEPIDHPTDPANMKSLHYDLTGVSPDEPPGWKFDPEDGPKPGSGARIPLEIARNKVSKGSPFR